jgi:hypothetical protein
MNGIRSGVLACALLVMMSSPSIASTGEAEGTPAVLSTDASNDGANTWQFLGAFAYVAILAAAAYAGVHIVRRRRSLLGAAASKAGQIRVVSTQRINLTCAVHLLEIRGETVVMATNGTQVHLLQLNARHG